MTIDRSKLPVVEFPLADFEADLVREEGRKLVPYKDNRGFWTVGIGHYIGPKLTSQFAARRPIPSPFVDLLFKEDVREALIELDKLVPWWRTLSPVRQRVLAGMMFQMGPHTLATFGATLDLIEAGDYHTAAQHMRASAWYRQTPNRAEREAAMMEHDRS